MNRVGPATRWLVDMLPWNDHDHVQGRVQARRLFRRRGQQDLVV